MRKPSLTLSAVALAAFLVGGCDLTNLGPGDDNLPAPTTVAGDPATTTTEAPPVTMTDPPDLPPATRSSDTRTDVDDHHADDHNDAALALQALVDAQMAPRSWEARITATTAFYGYNAGALQEVAELVAAMDPITFYADRRYRVTLCTEGLMQAGTGAIRGDLVDSENVMLGAGSGFEWDIGQTPPDAALSVAPGPRRCFTWTFVPVAGTETSTIKVRMRAEDSGDQVALSASNTRPTTLTVEDLGPVAV